jgi:hypothetical protein
MQNFLRLVIVSVVVLCQSFNKVYANTGVSMKDVGPIPFMTRSTVRLYNIVAGSLNEDFPLKAYVDSIAKFCNRTADSILVNFIKIHSLEIPPVSTDVIFQINSDTLADAEDAKSYLDVIDANAVKNITAARLQFKVLNSTEQKRIVTESFKDMFNRKLISQSLPISCSKVEIIQRAVIYEYPYMDANAVRLIQLGSVCIGVFTVLFASKSNQWDPLPDRFEKYFYGKN